MIVDVHALPQKSNPSAIRLVIISDTHELHEHMRIPHGDVLVHAGDILFADRFAFRWLSNYRLRNFFKWINSQPHLHKVVIAGNHDKQIQNLGAAAVKKLAVPAIYAENEVIVLHVPTAAPKSEDSLRAAYSPTQELRILASPWSVANSHRSPNLAFQSASLSAAIVSKATSGGNSEGSASEQHHQQHMRPDIFLCHQGSCCIELARLIQVIQPRVCHIGGHVHEGHGVTTIEGVPSINGSMMTGTYTKEKLLRPIVVDIVIPPR
jgi:DNA repair exonuclease SbcCD nuclease subunit